MRRVAIVLAMMAAAFCAAAPGMGTARAQAPPASVSGAVNDESGTRIPGATVEIANDRNRRSTVTDANGAYRLDNLPPGRYALTVTIVGFAPVTRRVDVGDSSQRLDVTLRLAIDQQVEVNASLEDFKRITGLMPVGISLGPEQLRMLPNDPDTMLQVLKELSATTGRADEVTVYVDGQPMTNRLPPKEAILSIRISTNPYSSEFAVPTGGLVEIVTKPAAATFRGEAQASLNDSRLNARNMFEPQKGPSRTQSQSGYFSGPILPGRWSVLGYGGRWTRDERLVINTPGGGAGLQVPAVVDSVAVPSTIDSYSLRTDVMVRSGHLVAVEGLHSSEEQRNAGLESGRDLRERAVTRRLDEDSGRLAVVSAFAEGIGSELRARVRRRTLHEAAVSEAPALLVLDAFNAGGNQAAQSQHRVSDDLSLSHILSYTGEGEMIRGGMQLDLLRLREQRRVNQGGTYTFGAVLDETGRIVQSPLDRYTGTLNGVPGYRPSLYSIARGTPSIALDDWRLGLFVQHDVASHDNLTTSIGLRYDLQRRVHRTWLNFAPRAGLAWRPAGSVNHTLRLAGGVFYRHIPPEVPVDAMREDGVRTVEYVVESPGFFPDAPTDIEATAAAQTVRVLGRLDAPTTMAGTLSYEWQVTRSVSAAFAYTNTFEYRLLRSRDVNDRSAGAPTSAFAGPVLQFESTGRSRANEIRATVRWDPLESTCRHASLSIL